MDDLRNIRIQLEAIFVHNSNNDTIQAALEHLSVLERELSMSTSNRLTWLALVNDLRHLQGQGLWGTIAEQRRLTDSVSQFMERSDSPGAPDISITMPPSSQRFSPVLVTTLSQELLENINEVYLLHTLATHPSKILPPGKSLLSLLSSRERRADANQTDLQETKTLKDQVGEVVTRAFWDEALVSLESPMPAVQLNRLRLLYIDLHTAVSALIPASHPIMYTLSDPLSPTSSPLRSASVHLRALLSVLRERCAPIRDAELDSLLERIKDPTLTELPKACIGTIKAIFDVADRMKNDLADFVVGTWTEQDARRWIKRKAVEHERRAVLGMFSAQMVNTSYREWLTSGSEQTIRPAVTRLMRALGSSESVSPFPPSNNLLPPPFIFTAFDLIKIQNLLQALVITASLGTLVRADDGANTAWLSRVWVLLEVEVEKGGVEPAETNVLNLEDEVVQAARLSGGTDGDSESRIREAVRRTLRLQDPVFVLLQTRLITAIQRRLNEEVSTPSLTQMPAQIRSGRGGPVEIEREERPQERELSVKGFEAEILKENVKRVVVMLRECLTWMEDAWAELLEGHI